VLLSEFLALGQQHILLRKELRNVGAKGRRQCWAATN
jgi:hypothetical protein